MPILTDPPWRTPGGGMIPDSEFTDRIRVERAHVRWCPECDNRIDPPDSRHTCPRDQWQRLQEPEL